MTLAAGKSVTPEHTKLDTMSKKKFFKMLQALNAFDNQKTRFHSTNPEIRLDFSIAHPSIVWILYVRTPTKFSDCLVASTINLSICGKT